MNLFFAMQANAVMQLLPIVIIMVIFYFFMLKPNIKKQAEQAEFSKNLKMGDEVVTTSGMIGKIISVNEKEVYLQVDKTSLRFTRNAISKEMTDAHKK